MLNKQQAITWTKADPIHSHISAALGGDELNGLQACYHPWVKRQWKLLLRKIYKDLQHKFGLWSSGHSSGIMVFLLQQTSLTLMWTPITHEHLHLTAAMVWTSWLSTASTLDNKDIIIMHMIALTHWPLEDATGKCRLNVQFTNIFWWLRLRRGQKKITHSKIYYCFLWLKLFPGQTNGNFIQKCS